MQEAGTYFRLNQTATYCTAQAAMLTTSLHDVHATIMFDMMSKQGENRPLMSPLPTYQTIVSNPRQAYQTTGRARSGKRPIDDMCCDQFGIG
jgi:hypothetical protein